MKFTPSSIARLSTDLATSRSGGSPQIPEPVIRIAPKPSRLTVRSPPMPIVPASAADAVSVMDALLFAIVAPTTVESGRLQPAAFCGSAVSDRGCLAGARSRWTPDARDVHRWCRRCAKGTVKWEVGSGGRSTAEDLLARASPAARSMRRDYRLRL